MSQFPLLVTLHASISPEPLLLQVLGQLQTRTKPVSCLCLHTAAMSRVVAYNLTSYVLFWCCLIVVQLFVRTGVCCRRIAPAASAASNEAAKVRPLVLLT